MYQLTESGVRRLSDSADIPNTPKNKDWRKYLKWLAIPENEPLPIADPPELVPNPLIAEVEAATNIGQLKQVMKKMLGEEST